MRPILHTEAAGPGLVDGLAIELREPERRQSSGCPGGNGALQPNDVALQVSAEVRRDVVSAGASPGDDGAKRSGQDVKIDPDRPVADVVGVERPLHLQIAVAAGGHLPKAGDARDDAGAQRLEADIESIQVLKGADAALYGIRGANGVIVITTKKAAAKREREDPLV